MPPRKRKGKDQGKSPRGSAKSKVHQSTKGPDKTSSASTSTSEENDLTQNEGHANMSRRKRKKLDQGKSTKGSGTSKVHQSTKGPDKSSSATTSNSEENEQTPNEGHANMSLRKQKRLDQGKSLKSSATSKVQQSTKGLGKSSSGPTSTSEESELPPNEGHANMSLRKQKRLDQGKFPKSSTTSKVQQSTKGLGKSSSGPTSTSEESELPPNEGHANMTLRKQKRLDQGKFPKNSATSKVQQSTKGLGESSSGPTSTSEESELPPNEGHANMPSRKRKRLDQGKSPRGLLPRKRMRLDQGKSPRGSAKSKLHQSINGPGKSSSAHTSTSGEKELPPNEGHAKMPPRKRSRLDQGKSPRGSAKSKVHQSTKGPGKNSSASTSTSEENELTLNEGHANMPPRKRKRLDKFKSPRGSAKSKLHQSTKGPGKNSSASKSISEENELPPNEGHANMSLRKRKRCDQGKSTKGSTTSKVHQSAKGPGKSSSALTSSSEENELPTNEGHTSMPPKKRKGLAQFNSPRASVKSKLHQSAKGPAKKSSASKPTSEEKELPPNEGHANMSLRKRKRLDKGKSPKGSATSTVHQSAKGPGKSSLVTTSTSEENELLTNEVHANMPPRKRMGLNQGKYPRGSDKSKEHQSIKGPGKSSSASTTMSEENELPPNEDVLKEGSGSINDSGRIITKGWTTLVDYIKPGPVLDCELVYKLFEHRTVRDLKEEICNTSDRNRKLLEKFRQRGDAGLKIFKECLKKSGQTKIADFIDCIEKGMDTDEIKREIAEEATKGSLHELQNDLIDSYRSDHSEMSLAPLLDKSMPLLQFFQMPDLERVTVRRNHGGDVEEERTPIDTWDKLFHDSNHANHRSTYVCADAGLGKTAFCKYLALAWCQSKKPLQEETNCFKPEHIEAIGKFRFVFLLSLRESGESKCHLKEMIWEQLVSNLVRSHKLEHLGLILRNEKCLIILDGLDEWTHPPTCANDKKEIVPHWSKRENVAVITTTRLWKFSVAGLNSGQLDQRIDLSQLNQKSANNLKYSFLSYFQMQKLRVKYLEQQDKEEVTEKVQEFNKTVSDKHATKLESVPLMLMYMIFLFGEGIELGETQCDLYCQIIELLLSRTVKQQTVVSCSTENIPSFFSDRTQCQQNYYYLKALGQLAFETLLKETADKNTLVFDSYVAEKYLGKDGLTYCLKTGIISQSKCVQTHPLISKSTVSFSHKTMQEFFAGLHMFFESDDPRMSQLVLSKCKNVQDILDMSKIVMFISGMNVNVAALIFRGVTNIINEDEIIQESRNKIGSIKRKILLKKDLQNMFASCCKEMPYASRDNLYIQDVLIDESCMDVQYRVNLKQLIQNNKQNIQSVTIYFKSIPNCSVQKVVEYFELKDLKNLVEIFGTFVKDTENLIPVFNTRVKSLQLMSGSLSRSLCDKVTSLLKLEVIVISSFTMSHSELRLLYDFISQKVDMRKIVLFNLNCSNHRSSCSGLSLDLSQHSQLDYLLLGPIPHPEVNINMASSEKRVLEWLPLIALAFTRVNCDTVNSRLNIIDVHIQVTIPASVLQDILTVIQKLPQTVLVCIMRKCEIKPESEWEILKKQIEASPHFTVLEEYNRLWLTFKAIKHGNKIVYLP